MSAFLYNTIIQFKLDIRSRYLLITYYIIPLIFFLFMGGIFISIMPEMSSSLIQSMIVMGASMSTFIGLPSSIAQAYDRDIKKMYKSNGIPAYSSFITIFISSFINTIIMSLIITALAPLIFDASLPKSMPAFTAYLSLYIASSSSIGCLLGLLVKSQSKLTMVSQLVFLPSIMLSGIMFPADLLPDILQEAGLFLPSSHGYSLMLNSSSGTNDIIYLSSVLIISILVCIILIRKREN